MGFASRQVILVKDFKSLINILKYLMTNMLNALIISLFTAKHQLKHC